MPAVFSLLSASDDSQLYSKHQNEPLSHYKSVLWSISLLHLFYNDPRQQPGIKLTMPHTFQSERALTEQLNTCETFLRNIFAAYNNVSSQLSEAENHTPNKHEIDTIRFAESVYSSAR